MRKLSVFNFVTLNGFYKGANEDTSWHSHGSEESQFSEESVKQDDILLFGRTTYEMMARFWPTPDALKAFPAVAEGMNKAEKIVFSRLLEKAEWNNTRIVRDNIAEEIKRMKKESGKNMTILGSGSIVTQFAEVGLIDEYQVMIDPVAIGEGTPMFNGIKRKLNLQLTGTRTFKSGVVLLSYKAAAF